LLLRRRKCIELTFTIASKPPNDFPETNQQSRDREGAFVGQRRSANRSPDDFSKFNEQSRVGHEALRPNHKPEHPFMRKTQSQPSLASLTTEDREQIAPSGVDGARLQAIWKAAKQSMDLTLAREQNPVEPRQLACRVPALSLL
jgi:hypothetical protein